MRTILIATLFGLQLVTSSLAAAESPTIAQAELVRRTQELVDAFAPGNKAPWKLYLADDALIFDERGRNMDKAAFLADLQPLPSGYAGSIQVTKSAARFAAGVAILSYDCDERETVFGQQLHARYHMTDTWVYRDAQWKIVASQTLRYYEDPATGNSPGARVGDYLGSYELAPGHTIAVVRHGANLYEKRGSGQPVELLPESPDLFFRPGAEGRFLFHRDASGRVDALIDRRNNEDLVWKRLP
ncbi:MAG: DUF4440 domain-containing protein [Candidatus Acidiferrales bacterium]